MISLLVKTRGGGTPYTNNIPYIDLQLYVKSVI